MLKVSVHSHRDILQQSLGVGECFLGILGVFPVNNLSIAGKEAICYCLLNRLIN